MTTPTQISRYEIIRELARGDVATIYLARDPEKGHEVAIKLLPEGYLGGDRQREAQFQDKIRHIARLQHSAIVPIYDVGKHGAQLYIVMHLMTGGTLADRLTRGVMSLADAGGVLRRVAAALDYAHGEGIIHRNLRPENILFSAFGEARVSDFGITRLPPEQTTPNDPRLAGRSDIYALGEMLFEMVSGQPPYRAGSPAALAEQHINAPVPRVSQINPRLHPKLDHVIAKALAKNPANRYATASSMAAAVSQIASIPYQPPKAVPFGTEAPAETAPDDLPKTMIESPLGDLAATTVEGTPVADDLAATTVENATPPADLMATTVENAPSAADLAATAVESTSATPQPTATAQRAAPTTSAATPASTTPDTSEVAGEYQRGGGVSKGLMWGCVALFVGGGVLAVIAVAILGVMNLMQPDTEATEAAVAAAASQTALAQPTATTPATATPTYTPTETATPAPTVNATATARMEQAIEAVGESPIFGPSDGELVHADDGFIKADRAGVNIRDFVVGVDVYAPYGSETGNWDIGFLFRHKAANDQYRLIIESNGNWQLVNRNGEDSTIVDEGTTDVLNTGAGDLNQMALIADGDTGELYINDTLVTELDLSGRTIAGDVFVASAITSGNEIPGEVTRYENFAIWPMPGEIARFAPTATAYAEFVDAVQLSAPVFGPVSGDLPHEPDDGQIETYVVEDAWLPNFVAEATFYNPYDADENLWDIGFIFRLGDSNGYRLVVISDGTWRLSIRIDGETIIPDRGSTQYLNTGANQVNHLRLVADGPTGFFYLNGEFVAELDLSEELNDGEIEIGTAFFTDTEQAGAVTSYEEFRIWELP